MTDMNNQSNENPDTSWSNFTQNQKLVTALVIFTGLSHIIFSFGWDSDILGINLGVWFVINGIGYLVLLYFLYFGNQFQEYRELIRYILVTWTLGSIIAWAVFHTSSDRYDTLLDASLINKSVEVAILLFLYLDTISSSK